MFLGENEDVLVGAAESRGLTTELPAAGASAQTLDDWSFDRYTVPRELAVPLETSRARFVATIEGEWEPHPFLPSSFIQALTRKANGDPVITMWHLQPGLYPAPTLPFALVRTFTSTSMSPTASCGSGSSTPRRTRREPRCCSSRGPGSIDVRGRSSATTPVRSPMPARRSFTSGPG
jgi:hypothetical protein